MIYQTECGAKTSNKKKISETERVMIGRKLIEGKPSKDDKEFDIADGCKDCPAKKVTEEQQYLNKDSGSIYKTEDTYCIAHAVGGSKENLLKDIEYFHEVLMDRRNSNLAAMLGTVIDAYRGDPE